MSSGGIQNKYSAGSVVGLGTSYTAVALGIDVTLGGQAVDAQCYLDKLLFSWSSIVTGVSFSWYLAYDVAGKYPITDPQEAVTMKTGLTGTFKVNAADLAGASYRATTQGRFPFLIAKVNAGSASLGAVLLWRAR